MDNNRIPKQGEIYHHFKDRLYQIITVATHTETDEKMVVYQALYGNFKTFVRPLASFLREVDQMKYPQVEQKYCFELVQNQDGEDASHENHVLNLSNNRDSQATNAFNENIKIEVKQDAITGNSRNPVNDQSKDEQIDEMLNPVSDNQESKLGMGEEVNTILLQFLDAKSYNKKLEVLTSNTKHMNDRLINDMAVALDCAVEEGPIEQRIQGLIQCLQAMRRFEDRRLR